MDHLLSMEKEKNEKECYKECFA